MIRGKDRSKGLTLIEIAVSIGIIALISGIGISVFLSSKKVGTQNAITDAIASGLEDTKTRAMSGKAGGLFGFAYSSTTYTYWTGAYYDPASVTNRTQTLPAGFSISGTVPNSSVYFERLTGRASATGTITVSDESGSRLQRISIGSEGDISVIK